MARFAPQTDRYAEYSILTDPSPIGPKVGFYAGRPIFTTVADELGQKYVYVGLARRTSNGQYDVGSLAVDEWIVEPGLVYRQIPRVGGKAGRTESGELVSRHPGGLLTIWGRWFH